MTGEQLTQRGIWQRPLFVAILFVAGYLRLDRLGLPSLWLDEILGYDIASAAAKTPLWRWLYPFEAEHGPLYHATELAGRFLSRPEMSARIWPAMFGIATVAVMWFAGRAIHPRVAAPAAILMALSPMAVYYSREGRPYALLMLLAACTIALILRGSRWAITPMVLMLYTSAIAVPFLMSTAIAARKRIPIAISAVLCTIAAFFLYSPSTARVSPFQFPAFSWTVALFALIAIIGAASADRTIVILSVGPAVLTIVALALRNHWYAPRYITLALPASLLLVACGIVAITRKTWLAIAAAIALAVPGIPRALHEPYEKVDWRGTAEFLRQHVHDWDILLLTNDWTDHSLGFYLRERPLKVNWINVHESVAQANGLVALGQRTWIVVDGFYSDDRIVAWAKRHHEVLPHLRFSEGGHDP